MFNSMAEFNWAVFHVFVFTVIVFIIIGTVSGFPKVSLTL